MAVSNNLIYRLGTGPFTGIYLDRGSYDATVVGNVIHCGVPSVDGVGLVRLGLRQLPTTNDLVACR